MNILESVKDKYLIEKQLEVSKTNLKNTIWAWV
ncbi:Uncharacterised protein (plasmid) [Mesomycoplasma conjunctivae]|uniref:Uncharacterized protein n=1 Tax=Mycoplasmopsis fermentans (strain M64) TaxID=943945 RepID=A0AB32XBJ3_MYCFM|nr:Hypothetical Protein MfeM64YM_0195 [Mycoplasmopsis fermentans M64]RMX36187.1 putative orfG1 [Mycoplasmopsis fermentans MF-I1]VEU60231.1 Uncharacterised protein [Mycoplasmopsis fermentans]VEU67698.1 Uncharacterised protein [Mesomycoplasma conjunctivae]